MAEKAGPRYPIESVDSALRLVRLIADDSGVTVSAAARHLDVAPSTAHRLLAMLQHYGLVEQNPASKTYSLGPWLVEIALRRLGEVDIRAAARPSLERLVGRVGETVHLVGLHGTDALFLDCVEGTMSVRATPRTGQRLLAHCTAAGKVQLAHLTRERLLDLYPDPQLDGLTAKSTRSREELLKELDRIAAAGYALNKGESEDDVHAVAAPILAPDGTVRGAITVAGPPARMPQRRMREIAQDTIAAAAEIGAALAGPGGTESSSAAP